MKSLLITIGSQILRSMIAAQSGPADSPFGSLFGSPRASTPMPDFAYLSRAAKRAFSLTATGFVCTLFFVFGTMMALGAVAQSFDLFGVFVAGAVFYTGFFVALASGIGLLACISKGRKIAFSWERFFQGSNVEMTAYTPTVTEASRPEMRTPPSTVAPSAPTSPAMASPASPAGASTAVPFGRSNGINSTEPGQPTGRPDSERMAS